MVRIGRRAADGIIEAVTEEEADLIIFGWGGPPTASQTVRAQAEAIEARLAGVQPSATAVFTPTIDAVVRESPCDIAVVKQRGLENVRSILVPVRGGPHADLAFRLAHDLGRRFDAQVVVMHIVPKGIGDRAAERERLAMDQFLEDHGATRRVKPLLVEATSVRAGIIKEAAKHDLVVMGAAAQPSTGGSSADGRYLFGSVPEAVASRAPSYRDRGQDQAVGRDQHLRRAAGRRGQPARRGRLCRAQPLTAERRRQVVRREHLPRPRVHARSGSWSP